MKATRPKTRILLTVQSVAGLALLALAVPYSGCFTGRVWNDDTVLIAAKREGRTEFRGRLDQGMENTTGDLAYPGTMRFVNDDDVEWAREGWLIIPAKHNSIWMARISGMSSKNEIMHNIFAPMPSPDGPLHIAVNPRPAPSYLGLGYHSRQKFLEANEFDFKTAADLFDPAQSGYKPIEAKPQPEGPGIKIPAPGPFSVSGRTLGGLPPPQAAEPNGGNLVFINPPPNLNAPQTGGTDRVVIPGRGAELNFHDIPGSGALLISRPSGEFVLEYNPLQRTGWSDAMNTTSKVVLTLPAVAGDVVTGAAVVGGVVVAGGAVIVTAPFAAAGKAIGKARKEKPECPPKSSDETPEQKEIREVVRRNGGGTPPPL